jgi:hypothetical protein
MVAQSIAAQPSPDPNDVRRFPSASKRTLRTRDAPESLCQSHEGIHFKDPLVLNAAVAYQ